MTAPDDQTIIEHTRRWLEKAVIGLNLCPFAKAPYAKGLVRISVSQARIRCARMPNPWPDFWLSGARARAVDHL